MAYDYRGILALLSGLVGIVLLIAALHLTSRRSADNAPRRRATPVLVYSILFLTLGVLLWWRQSSKGFPLDSPPPVTATPPIETVPAEPPPADTFEVSASPRNPMPSAADTSEPAAVKRSHSADSSLAKSGRPVLAVPAPIIGGVAFPKIAFQPGSAELTGSSKSALEKLAEDLKRRPELKIEIQAYLDSLGPEANHFALTQTRASTIRDFLVVKGVAASRLSAQGFGSPASSDSPITFVVRR